MQKKLRTGFNVNEKCVSLSLLSYKDNSIYINLNKGSKYSIRFTHAILNAAVVRDGGASLLRLMIYAMAQNKVWNS